MPLTFNQEDKEWLETAMAKAVETGLSAIGLGYDNEEGKRAIRSDLEWARRGRTREEERASTFRRSLMGSFGLTIAAGILYLAVHLHDFGQFLIRLSEGSK